jgi:hypothetical protein
MAIKAKFANQKNFFLKNYKLHSKLYKLNLEDTMVGCLKKKLKIEWWINKYNLHKSNKHYIQY